MERKNMNNNFIFNIDPEELPFYDEDDLGDDEPRVVEYIAQQIKKQDALFVVNPKRFSKAMQIATTLIKSAQDNCSKIKCSMSYDNLIGRDMYLKIVGILLCFDEDVIASVRNANDGIVGAIDISTTVNGEAELNVAFKDVRVRAPLSPRN